MTAIRGSDVFLKADLLAILRSIALAQAAALAAGVGNADYAAGQRTTLVVVAVALGIEPAALRVTREEYQ